MTKPKLLSLCGVARCGKDTLAKPLLARGWHLLNVGTLIKDFYKDYVAGDQSIPQLREKMMEVAPELSDEDWQRFYAGVLLPFESADLMCDSHTEVDEHKKILRPILEDGGELIYDWLLREYFRRVDAMTSAGKNVVNTRVSRLAEAKEWHKRGAEIILIDCLHREAVSDWEKRSMAEIKQSGYITRIIGNWGSAEDWEYFAQVYVASINAINQKNVNAAKILARLGF